MKTIGTRTEQTGCGLLLIIACAVLACFTVMDDKFAQQPWYEKLLVAVAVFCGAVTVSGVVAVRVVFIPYYWVFLLATITGMASMVVGVDTLLAAYIVDAVLLAVISWLVHEKRKRSNTENAGIGSTDVEKFPL